MICDYIYADCLSQCGSSGAPGSEGFKVSMTDLFTSRYI